MALGGEFALWQCSCMRREQRLAYVFKTNGKHVLVPTKAQREALFLGSPVYADLHQYADFSGRGKTRGTMTGASVRKWLEANLEFPKFAEVLHRLEVRRLLLESGGPGLCYNCAHGGS